MPDTLNPESLRRAEAAYLAAEDPNALHEFLRAYLAAEGERVQNIGLVLASVAEMRRHHAARRALRDAIGDLLHMHRQGVVSAEMWERVAAAFDGEAT